MGNVVAETLWILYGILVQIFINWNLKCIKIETTIEIMLEY
jgi:hypothetical protein